MAESAGFSTVAGTGVTEPSNVSGAHGGQPAPMQGMGWDPSPGTRPAIAGQRGRSGGGPWANMARMSGMSRAFYSAGRRKKAF